MWCVGCMMHVWYICGVHGICEVCVWYDACGLCVCVCPCALRVEGREPDLALSMRRQAF